MLIARRFGEVFGRLKIGGIENYFDKHVMKHVIPNPAAFSRRVRNLLFN
jgi:hypothetical protein